MRDFWRGLIPLRIPLTATFLGITVGYVVLSPFAMYISHVAHMDLPYKEMSVWDVYSPKLYLWSLSFTLFSGSIGLLIGILYSKIKKTSEKIKKAHDELELHVNEKNTELRKQNKFLKNILESIIHPFYVINSEDYTVILANSAAVDELPEKKTCYELIHKRDKPCNGIAHTCLLEEIKKTKKPVTVEHVHFDKKGNPRNTEVHGYPITDIGGEITHIIEYSIDITERKKIKKDLKRKEESLIEIQRIGHMGNWEWNIENGELYWSDEIYHIFRLSPQEFGASYKAFLSYVHPDDREFVKTSVNNALYEKKPYNIEHRILLQDGSERTVNERGKVFFDEDGAQIKMVGTVQDITERKKIEKEQIMLQKRLKGLWKIAKMVDEDYQTLCNYVLEEITKMTESRYSFFGTLDERESIFTIYSWSKEVLDGCKIQDKPIKYPIDRAGIWGDAVRKRQVLMVNDYRIDHPSKKGLPEGHIPIYRILVVPIFRKKHIIALGAVANKTVDYTEDDAKQIEAFITNALIVLEHRKLEKNRLDAIEQLLNNLKTFDKSADRLRNPLAVITSSLEMMEFYGKDRVLEIVDEQTNIIKKRLDELRDEEIKTYELVKPTMDNRVDKI